MRRIAWLFGLVFAAVALVLGGLSAFLAPGWFGPVEGDGWRAELPRLALAPARYAEGPWTFVAATGSAEFRVGTRPANGPTAVVLAESATAWHPRPVERIAVPSLDGTFLLSGRGKQWRATLLFPAGGRIFAVESVESRGNAAEPLLAVSRIAASLEVEGPGFPFVAPPREVLEAAVRPAVERHLVGMGVILPGLLPILLVTLGVALAVLWYGGRLPERAPGAPPPLLAEANVFLEMRRGRWQFRQTVGALVLDADGLRVFTLGREVARIPRPEFPTIRRVPGRGPRRPFEVHRADLRVRFAPSDPARWALALGVPSDAS